MRKHENAGAPRRDQFAYINHHYGLSLTKNCAVIQTSTGRRGQVASTAPGQQHYLSIRWDGARFASGPFHPTSDLEYPQATAEGARA